MYRKWYKQNDQKSAIDAISTKITANIFQNTISSVFKIESGKQITSDKWMVLKYPSLSSGK